MSRHNRERRQKPPRRPRVPLVGFLPVRRVGQVEHVPPGHELGSCGQCEAPVWVHPRRVAQIAGAGFEPVLVCDACVP